MVERANSRPESSMLCAFVRMSTREKPTRSRPPAGGCPWSRSMPPRRSSGRAGPATLLDAFEGRRILIAYYFMWHAGHPAAEQCEGCSLYTAQVRELSFLHSRDVTYATFCQGPVWRKRPVRRLHGWQMPWYSASRQSLETPIGRTPSRHDAYCLLPSPRRPSFETYWTTRRGVAIMSTAIRFSICGLRAPEAWEDRRTAGRSGRKARTLTATTDTPLFSGRA